QACRRFIYTENLRDATDGSPQSTASAKKPLEPLTKATSQIKKAIAELDSDDGWYPLGGVGKQLSNLNSDFDSRNYGVPKLSDLVRKTGAFDIETPKGGSMRIRLKPSTRK
ncbi:MAG: OST-HTH/LOTUS domain-containing protein, partial [Sneathiella sp.]